MFEYNLDIILPDVYDADIIKGELGSPFCIVGAISPEGLSFLQRRCACDSSKFLL